MKLGVADDEAREGRSGGAGGGGSCKRRVDGLAVCAYDEGVSVIEMVEQLVHVGESETAAGKV